MTFVKLNSDGHEVDRIEADADFVAQLSGDWREYTEELAQYLHLKAIRTSVFAVFAALPIELRLKWYGKKIEITAAFDDADVEVAVLALLGLEAETQDEIEAKATLTDLITPFIPPTL